MSEVKKDTGLGHDDDGNWDDRRIAGWILLVASIGLAAYGVHVDAQFTPQIFSPAILAVVGLFGSTVAEKFGKKGQ